jgi:hypothetical protein
LLLAVSLCAPPLSSIPMDAQGDALRTVRRVRTCCLIWQGQRPYRCRNACATVPAVLGGGAFGAG